MQVAPILTDTFDLGAFCRGLVVALITASRDDPSEMKARIMLAWEHGHLTADEAADWIAMAGLAAA